MRLTLGLLVVIGIMDIVLIMLTNIKTSLFTQLAIKIGFVVGFYIVFSLIHRTIMRLFKVSPVLLKDENDAPLINARIIIVIFATFIIEFIVLNLLSNYGGQITIDILYFFVLALSGIAFAAWCKSAWYVPIFSTTVILLVLSTIHSVNFYFDANIQSQFGADTLMFTLSNQAENLSKLPINLAVTWVSWRIITDYMKVLDFARKGE